MLLYQLENPRSTMIVKRPSQFCKTPYVADIEMDGTSYLAHTPALGCCGLSDKGSTVVVSPVEKKGNKCAYTVYLSILEEKGNTIVVGIHPKIAETLVERMLDLNCLAFLKNHREMKREFSILNSRFDFTGKDCNGRPYVMEVKNVPLADYVDVAKKDRKKYKHIEETKQYNEKIAYFPDGYRKSGNKVVSERALKHVEELSEIVSTTPYRAILCFVIQRTDVACFQPSNIDPTYKAAVRKSYEQGVEIYAVQVKWTKDGECTFVRDNLPLGDF